MIEKPLVSLVMPTYNVVDSIREAVDSIIDQTLTDWELIIVDDQSTDGTWQALQQYRDARIQLFRLERHEGIVTALNRGLDASRGQFIARMDGDDISLPQRLERQLAFLSSRPECDLVGSDFACIDENGNVYALVRQLRGKPLQQFLKAGAGLLHGTFFFRRSVYIKLKGYRFDFAEDYDFLTRLHTKGLQFDNLPESLYQHRRRKGNTFTLRGINLRQIKTHIYIQKLYQQRLKYQREWHDEQQFLRYIRSSSAMEWLHHGAALMYFHASRLETSWFRMPVQMLSCLMSPYLFYLLVWLRLRFWKGYQGRHKQKVST